MTSSQYRKSTEETLALSGGQERLARVTWSSALGDEVKVTGQRESRRQREWHGQKALEWKGQSEMKILQPKHKQQRGNMERRG